MGSKWSLCITNHKIKTTPSQGVIYRDFQLLFPSRNLPKSQRPILLGDGGRWVSFPTFVPDKNWQNARVPYFFLGGGSNFCFRVQNWQNPKLPYFWGGGFLFPTFFLELKCDKIPKSMFFGKGRLFQVLSASDDFHPAYNGSRVDHYLVPLAGTTIMRLMTGTTKLSNLTTNWTAEFFFCIGFSLYILDLCEAA